jgi:hypothetical protein
MWSGETARVVRLLEFDVIGMWRGENVLLVNLLECDIFIGFCRG